MGSKLKIHKTCATEDVLDAVVCQPRGTRVDVLWDPRWEMVTCRRCLARRPRGTKARRAMRNAASSRGTA